jgi:hypothetical protein
MAFTGMSGSSPEDRIRALTGRQPVPRPTPPPPPAGTTPGYGGTCYPQCDMDGSVSPVQPKMCMRSPDPRCGSNGAPVTLAPALPPAPELAQWLDKTKPGWSAGMSQYGRGVTR